MGDYTESASVAHLRELASRNEGCKCFQRATNDLGRITERHQEVIEIHDGMYTIIHRSEPQSRANSGVKSMPTVEENLKIMEIGTGNPNHAGLMRLREYHGNPSNLYQ